MPCKAEGFPFFFLLSFVIVIVVKNLFVHGTQDKKKMKNKKTAKVVKPQMEQNRQRKLFFPLRHRNVNVFEHKIVLKLKTLKLYDQQ